MSGDTVVWMDWGTSAPGIYAYDLKSKSASLIVPGFINSDQLAIDGDIVVWTEAGNIFGYDLAKHSQFQISTSGTACGPDVSGNLVVWQDYRNSTPTQNNNDIYGYDIDRGVEFPVCLDSGSQCSPRISGNTVVWQSDDTIWVPAVGWEVVEAIRGATLKSADWDGSVVADGGATDTRDPELNLALTASSSAGSVTDLRLAQDGGAWGGWESFSSTKSLTLTGDGQRTVSAQFRDSTGCISPTYSCSILLDSTPPTTSDDADSAWHSQSVTVHLTAADSGTGVSSTQYSLDNAPWQMGSDIVVSAPATHSNDGVHHIAYRSTDEAGNIEVTRQCSVAIDTSPPVTTTSGDNLWHNSPVTLTLDAVDTGCGVAFVDYNVDGVAWLHGTSMLFLTPANHSGDGVHTIYYRATDHLGYTEDLKTCYVRIDTAQPSTKAPKPAAATRYRYAVLRYRVNDPSPNGGRASVVLKLKNAHGKVVKTINLHLRTVNSSLSYRYRCTLPRGKYRFFVYATDVAGNHQTAVGSNRLTIK